jgi:hypothetical protein
MTDFRDFRDDELASAYLDGEAAPEEAAEVVGNPVLLARVEAFRAVSAQVAAGLEPAAAADRDRHLAAALDAAAGAERAAATSVTSLADRRRRASRMYPIVAVAAAVLLVVAAIPLLARSGSRGDDAAMSAATTEAAGGSAEADGVASAPSSPGESATSLQTLAAPTVQYGSYASTQALADAIDTQLRAVDSAASNESTDRDLTCSNTLKGLDSSLGTLTLTVDAVVDGEAVRGFVYEVGPDAFRLVVVASVSCTQVGPPIDL